MAQKSKSGKASAKTVEEKAAAAAKSSSELLEAELAALDAEINAQLDAEAVVGELAPEWFVVHSYSGMEHKVKKSSSKCEL